MKFSPKLKDIKIGPRKARYYGQWFQVFKTLHKNNTHEQALQLLTQYNQYWSEATEFEEISANDYGVPEYGMLSALGYNVSDATSELRSNNINPDTRLALLKHIYSNECPPLHNKTYRDKWGKPSSGKRLDKIISVLESLTKSKDARYKRNAKAVQRWTQDIEVLKEFRTSLILAD